MCAIDFAPLHIAGRVVPISWLLQSMAITGSVGIKGVLFAGCYEAEQGLVFVCRERERGRFTLVRSVPNVYGKAALLYSGALCYLVLHCVVSHDDMCML